MEGVDPEVRLVTLHSHYRSIIQPLTKLIDTVQYKASESNYRVTVVYTTVHSEKRLA